MPYQRTGTTTPADTAEAYADGRAAFSGGRPRPTSNQALYNMQQGWDDAAMAAHSYAEIVKQLQQSIAKLETFVTDSQRVASALLKYHKATPGDKRNARGVMLDADAINETINKIREKL